MTPTQRSMNFLKLKGYTPRIVEHFNHYAKVRQDLFGFIDIVALHPESKGVLGVQTTSAANISARVNKAMALSVCKLWLVCGNRVEFHGWKQVNGHWTFIGQELVLGMDGEIIRLSWPV